MTDEQTTDITEATDYTKAEQAHYEAIRKKEREVGNFATKADDTRRTVSAAKKAFEAADEELRELIRGGPDLQQRLPGMADGKPSEEWQELPLSALGLGDFYTGKLADVKVTTLGELSAWMAGYGSQWWRNIPGIGEGKAETISGCLANFWKAHPEYCESPPDEVAEPSNSRIKIKFTRDIINELDKKLAAAGETIFVAMDSHGKLYLVDPANGERAYLVPDDYEVVE